MKNTRQSGGIICEFVIKAMLTAIIIGRLFISWQRPPIMLFGLANDTETVLTGVIILHEEPGLTQRTYKK